MPEVVVVGDGPGGLSAALFLAKNKVDVIVYGKDRTALHWAHLYNYLGIPEIPGSRFQEIARSQAEARGAKLRDDLVVEATRGEAGFTVVTEGGERIDARFLVLSEGKNPSIAGQLGLAVSDVGIAVDSEMRTSVPGVYAVGRMVRPGRSQVIISAGDGAKAALDILATLAGKDKFSDWDQPPER